MTHISYHVCNRCGVQIPTEEERTVSHWYGKRTLRVEVNSKLRWYGEEGSVAVDLCPRCHAAVVDFVNGKDLAAERSRP